VLIYPCPFRATKAQIGTPFYTFISLKKVEAVEEIRYYEKGNYLENDINYFDVKDFPQLAEIEQHWPELKEELQAFIREKDTQFETNTYQNVNVEGGWSSLSFMFWGGIITTEFQKKCPRTWAYLSYINGLTLLSLSRLSPNSSIARHRGDTNAVMRCHLGIEVPAGLPQCGLRVKEEDRGWAEGKWLLFNDSCIHSAWNQTDKRRIVLIIDVVRPEFLHKKNSICNHIMTYQVINNKLGRKTAYKDSSFLVKKVLFAIVYGFLSVYRPLQNLFKDL